MHEAAIFEINLDYSTHKCKNFCVKQFFFIEISSSYGRKTLRNITAPRSDKK